MDRNQRRNERLKSYFRGQIVKLEANSSLMVPYNNLLYKWNGCSSMRHYVWYRLENAAFGKLPQSLRLQAEGLLK